MGPFYAVSPSDNDVLPSSPPKKRRLKHPRTARACIFCRRRKVRCTGTQPCDYCHGEGVRCEYDDGIPRPRPARGSEKPKASSPVARDVQSNLLSPAPVPQRENRNLASSTRQALSRPDITTKDYTPHGSRRPSLEPPQTFAGGQHIGPTAGVSFLYHVWNQNDINEGESLPSAPLTCYGDIPQTPMRQEQPFPTREGANSLLERYFRFATPTYRFLHRPTLEKWMSELLAGSRLPMAEAACALIVCSQSLLYTTDGERYSDGGDEDLSRSRFYFEKAKSLLNQEPGPASLASVQARLAMCLYLLSTFRINECRFCFSLACTILTSIGLHRKTPMAHKLDLVTLESRKRTFWCAYVLDDYLSVMLGRPRILRDEDIDQSYPRNIDDHDLLSSESLEDLPQHGNLEAFIAHADLAKLMGRNNDLLYPIQPLTEDQVFERTNEMLELLYKWKDALPDFLKPRDKTLVGQRTFERQNTVLKLAYAHIRILVTRRCLLADLSRLGRNAPLTRDDRALKPIRECASAISTILNATYELIERGALYQAFWFTQYIALVAISTLYVFIIQDARSTIPADLVPDLEMFFDKANHCQQCLTTLAPEGSQARRHYTLLSRLRLRAEKDRARTKKHKQIGSVVEHMPPSTAIHDVSSAAPLTIEPAEDVDPTVHTVARSQELTGNNTNANGSPSNEMDVIIGQFTLSEDDYIFQNLLGWGWESLDTVGFPRDGDLYNLQA
ncbi:uncharacterized protein Z518_08506 [Rhinocladiella mackenziei CBS 650.93]|uniref:Rhinocladiella mackenziei CBS 650.93 unplaced genomic scaffold supercont1.6, whole genome shotgun sequence n=1 Tax=Rhinocladiella mackenziei CBS 650.93 TaxID=1442369 RepID=A0A0D2J129_9EURO|nr:uncharacterized protein Z518_08506 [Rhinocladiella mackenziei CBS 650.93]KIX02565.1 hypothetical protein Z518_08506 [Rhinocladiella mackenziei CBS 650.93]